MGSRDLRRVYVIDPKKWEVLDEKEPPGIPWAAVATNGTLRFTIGPEFTGSYLSYDGENLYLSQWYKHRILKLDAGGDIIRVIDIGAEVSGHAFVKGLIYVLRGTEQNGESWTIARLDPQKERTEVKDIAVVPFACRSLTFDGELFWSNYRAKDTIISFALPN